MRNKFQWNFNLNTNFFIKENAYENIVCKIAAILSRCQWVNSLRPRQNGRHFTNAIFKCIFVNENDWIPIKISLKFVPKGPINNIQTMVLIMAWRCPGDKPLSEPMMDKILTHICVTRPQWVKQCRHGRRMPSRTTWLCATSCKDWINISRGSVKQPSEMSWHQVMLVKTWKVRDWIYNTMNVLPSCDKGRQMCICIYVDVYAICRF